MSDNAVIEKIEMLTRTVKLLETRVEELETHEDLRDLEKAIVETRALKQAVRRNPDRFPADFMFELNTEEIENLVSQNVIPSLGKLGGATPMAFTEQGVAMLSSVLRGDRAVQVNIAIMRAFVRLREMLGTNADLARKLEEMEKKYDGQFRMVFDAIRQLMAPSSQPARELGFHTIPPPQSPKTFKSKLPKPRKGKV